MKYYGKAESVASAILDAFKSGNLPQALAPMFIQRKDKVPCRAWSWANQLVVAIHGHSDARGFRQWEAVGRHVRKGEKALHILAPLIRKVEDTDSAGRTVERPIVYGFKSVPVFGLRQTDGEPLSTGDTATDNYLASLPFLDVAKAWGLNVEAYSGKATGALGYFQPGTGTIAVGVRNLSTWAHELTHAADFRLGNLKRFGQHWRTETVAELGGAVLLEALGLAQDSDRGGCFEYIQAYAKAAEIDAITACMRVLKRTCDAVALVLDTAEALQNGQPAESVSLDAYKAAA